MKKTKIGKEKKGYRFRLSEDRELEFVIYANDAKTAKNMAKNVSYEPNILSGHKCWANYEMYDDATNSVSLIYDGPEDI